MPINPAYQFMNVQADLSDKNQFMDLVARPQPRPVPNSSRVFTRPMPQVNTEIPQMPEQPQPEVVENVGPQGFEGNFQELPMASEPPQPDKHNDQQNQELQRFEQTKLAQRGREMGFDPRQLMVALAQFSAGMGNIKGKDTKSTAADFYSMQKNYENQQADRDFQQQKFAAAMQPKTVDPLNQEYLKARIAEMNRKGQPVPAAQPKPVDPLDQQYRQEQIELMRTRRRALEAGMGSDASLPEVAGGEPKMSPKSIKMASELRKEYQNNAITKTTRDVKAQWNKVRDVLENPSAAGDMAAIFMFMKTLDPGSTVREGEYKSAAEATSAAGRVQTYAQNVSNGSKLNPEQRLDFKRTIEKFYRAQIKEQDRVNKEYRQLAERSGIDARDLMIESDDAPKKLKSINDLPDVR